MQSTTPSLDITWQRPTFLLPLFCVCSLLGVSNSLASAIGLALMLSIAVTCMAILVALLHRFMDEHSEALLWPLIGGTVIALLERLAHALFYGLYRDASLFLPLGVVACLLLARRDLRSELTSLRMALRTAILMSAGFTLAAVVLGAGRELVGHGSLLHDAGALFGAWAQPLAVHVFRADMGFLLAVLAPGAFIALGIGVALYNWLWLQLSKLKST